MKRLIISLLLFATVSFATTINVPADQSTIQAGIDAASSGDTVLVASGTYTENINFNGKNIVVGSYYLTTGTTSYISSTIMDGGQNGTLVTFENGESSSALLTGFTLKNSGAGYSGGGIAISSSSPTIQHLIIEDNSSAGIYIAGTCTSSLSDLIIRNNTSPHGAGVYVTSNSGINTSPVFTNVEITNNYGSISGGLHLRDWSNATFINATIYGNSTPSDGGTYGDIGGVIVWYGATTATFTNSIIYGNTPTNVYSYGTLNVTYSDVQGGWTGTGNIDADPLFVDATNGDYHLTSSSPCIDAGDPASDLDPDGTVADMGVYYYDQSSSATNTYSLNFDGVDDYVNVGSQLDISGDFTIVAAIKISESDPENVYTIYSKSDETYSAGPAKGYMLELYQGVLHFGHRLNNSDNWAQVNSNTGIDYNQWYNVAVTRSSSDIQLFIDGVTVGSGTFSGDITFPATVNTYIGRNWMGDSGYPANYHFEGFIDEVSLWSEPLTQEEIQSYMSTSLAGNETGLVSYWNFNEGTGTTLTDQTSNDNDGTIYGATWSTDVPFTGATTTSALTWSVQAKASISTYTDNDNYLGVASSATNTFDASYDVLEPPASPGSSISLYFPHPEWNSILGDNFSTDARLEIALTDTMQVWDFEVVSTDAGDATLTFVFSDVPSVPVILENTATGVRQTLSNNATYTFTAVADSAHPFRVSIGDTTAPALALGSSCTGPAILISDSTHSLGWTSTDGYEVDSVLVSFSSDSGTTYSLQAALGTVSGYSWTVPDAVVMTAGKFKIKAQDYAGNSTEKESDYVFAIAGDSLSAAVTAGWTLWGAPINPANDTMTINLDDDFTDYWDTFDYVDNGYTYNGILKEAEGYWLGAAQDATIDVKGTPIVSDFTMSLSQGWELISNPLVLDVSVDSLTFTKDATTKTHAEAVTAGWVNSIYGYSSTGYVAASTFAPWSGYWVAVLETGVDMTFPIHRHDGSGSARSREDDWMITFDAQVDGANDGTTMIGYAETATDGFDAEHDAVQPPNPPGPDYVSLFIAHPEWNYPLGDKFAKDIRASVPDDEYKEWLLSIESSESDVQLNWTLMNIPDDYEVGYTIDDGIYFNDMRSVGTINISADTEIIVRVGSQVLGIDDETIPDVYALQQNYPNPFNPITTLRYDLPEQANVNIIIYDMLGRQVKSLINQTQDAGFKSVIWNATNDYGKPVSAGVYLYQIRAGKFVQTRKMVLLK